LQRTSANSGRYPTAASTPQSGEWRRPAESSGSGRRERSVVARTSTRSRRSALDDFSSISDDTRFRLKIAFFRYIHPEARVELLERRRAYLTEKLAQIRAQLRSYRERIDAYAYRLMEHGVDTTAADIKWIDGLIAEEKARMSGMSGGQAANPAGAT
jgi:hypothetical protein